ncbi:MAG TPA: aspartate 1-decarboxylase [Dehalococcoidia bacterium]|nr:aspartate 1-decarboxylase [Dehalococcoidia bacterium]
MRIMLKSKIHRAHVTETNINYEGSITVDKKLMEEADILPYEQVQVLDISNGARFTTYAIEGECGEICINGAAARLVTKEDTVIILSYCHVDDSEARNYAPKLVYVDAQNAITETKRAVEALLL